MQGHKDREKTNLVQETTFNQSSIRIFVALATIFDICIWSQDISQAYIQSSTKLLRDLYLKPKYELTIIPGCLLNVLRPFMVYQILVTIGMANSKDILRMAKKCNLRLQIWPAIS